MRLERINLRNYGDDQAGGTPLESLYQSDRDRLESRMNQYFGHLSFEESHHYVKLGSEILSSDTYSHHLN